MSKNMSDFVKLVIKQNGLTVQQYCEIIGISYQSFYYKLRNNTFSIKDLNKLQETLHFNMTVECVCEDGSRVIVPINSIK